MIPEASNRLHFGPINAIPTKHLTRAAKKTREGEENQPLN